MSPIDLGTAEGAMLFVTGFLGPASRDRLETLGELLPQATLFVTHDAQTGEPFGTVEPYVILTQVSNVAEKERFTAFLRSEARRLHAVGLAMAFEAWALPDIDTRDLRRYQRTGIVDAPGRQEAIVLTLQHRLVPSTVWLAPITRSPDGSPVAGEFERRGDKVDGRMFTVLPPDFWQ